MNSKMGPAWVTLPKQHQAKVLSLGKREQAALSSVWDLNGLATEWVKYDH